MRIRVNRQLLAEVREVASDRRPPWLHPYLLGVFDAEDVLQRAALQRIADLYRTGKPSARQQAASAEDGADD